MLDENFSGINNHSCGWIPLLEKLRHVTLNKLFRRPQRDLLKLKIQEVYPSCEDPRDRRLRNTKPIRNILLKQSKAKADQSRKEFFVNSVDDPYCCDQIPVSNPCRSAALPRNQSRS